MKKPIFSMRIVNYEEWTLMRDLHAEVGKKVTTENWWIIMVYIYKIKEDNLC